MLTIENLTFSYDGVQALSDVSVTARKGEITCILGRNGVGKTTLLKNIIGLLRASRGKVAVDDVDLTKLPANGRARSGLGFVPQGRQIFPRLTVEENLRVGLEATKNVREVPAETYDLFPVLKEMGSRMGGDLSGGQQQQLAIARALVSKPQVLLLDEPTEGIQPNIIKQIGSVLTSLARDRGMTIVLVEQYLAFVRDIGDSFYVLNRGRVVAQGQTSQLNEDLIHRHLSA
jgi:urea transport system ATP-binding protein